MGTFRLVDPDPGFQRSFLDAADEFVASGQPSYAGIVHLPEAGVVFTREGLEEPAEFARLVAYLLGDRREDSPRPDGWVPATVKWIVEDDEYVGRVSLRHRLTPDLLTWGGHIGYGVRPSARGRGAATYALRAMLEVAGGRGIARALVTCDVDNEASRRTIERNGGVYEDTREGKLRYWVRTRP
ncbi:GNAT family N-acetyltransferase [Nocardioides iriomotensis]|uniref:GNAT family N-acetyltransferase n=1 Tax=Nocardioides iriomotensis TaxID=715784 RepID=A0A4Q5J6H0_9ACTN|nr:GNAT family N-acetyltransferase [Nocardioides iriomotensis]RYU14134.1 GNAT family N-acetyltransferase [Nocardioides iriomotensis]